MNVDPNELAKFAAESDRWWDPQGPFKPLHDINPARLEFVAARVSLPGCKLLDVGCGGGIFSEALAAAGAEVTGIDAAGECIAAARRHAAGAGLAVDYQTTALEPFAEQHRGTFQVVTCMELLEHVPDPASLLRLCADLLRPGGQLFAATLNRTARSYLAAVLGAEYLLRLLPRGTHDFQKFIRPSELAAWLRAGGLELRALAGLRYNPLIGRARLSDDVGVNYLAHAEKP